MKQQQQQPHHCPRPLDHRDVFSLVVKRHFTLEFYLTVEELKCETLTANLSLNGWTNYTLSKMK